MQKIFNLTISMGNCNASKDQQQDEILLPSKSDFNMMYVIGRGGFGKVEIPLFQIGRSSKWSIENQNSSTP